MDKTQFVCCVMFGIANLCAGYALYRPDWIVTRDGEGGNKQTLRPKMNLCRNLLESLIVLFQATPTSAS